jgi:hypothetical protein
LSQAAVVQVTLLQVFMTAVAVALVAIVVLYLEKVLAVAGLLKVHSHTLYQLTTQ